MKNTSDLYFKTKNLTVGYGSRTVVADINVELLRGRILTLIGPNGAGKSTILRTITGELAPIAGDIFIDGKNIKSISASALSRIMAIVLTERPHTEMLTCADVVATGRYPYTGRMGLLEKRDKDAVAEALEIVEMTDFYDTDFANVSDGEKQRVMLARAICQEPELIILDEPTSYLDIKHKLIMLDILRRLVAERNVTVIMSLHELMLARRLADQVLCIKDGRIDRQGAPSEIFTHDYIMELYDIDIAHSAMFDELITF